MLVVRLSKDEPGNEGFKGRLKDKSRFRSAMKINEGQISLGEVGLKFSDGQDA